MALFIAVYFAFGSIEAALALAAIPVVLGTFGMFPALVSNVSAVLFIVSMIWIAVPEQQREAIVRTLDPSLTAADKKEPPVATLPDRSALEASEQP